MRLNNFVMESTYIDPYNMVVEVYNRSLPYIMELIREFHHITLKTPMLLSGRNSGDVLITKPIRTDRRPKDTRFEVHLIVDDIFDDIFNIRARSNSIFVTGKYSTAGSYGDSVYGIFPNGTDYRIVWSPTVHDLYSDVLDSSEYRYLGYEISDVVNDILENSDIEDRARDELTTEFENENSKDDFDSEDEFYEDLDTFIDANLSKLSYDMAEKEARDAIGNDEDELRSFIKHNYKEGDLKDAIMHHTEVMLSGRSYTGVIYNYLPYLLRYMEVYGAKKPTFHMFTSAMVGIDFTKYPGDGTSIKTYQSRLMKDIDMSDLKQ